MPLKLRVDDEPFLMRGIHAGRGGEPARAFSRNRTCTRPGCDTRLSMYNAGELCWQHEPVRTFVNMAHRRAGDRMERKAS